MILRRLMSHMKEQNWFAVGLDFLVVVAGLLIGLQIDRWREKTSLAEAEHHYLTERLINLESFIPDVKNYGENFYPKAQKGSEFLQSVLITKHYEPADRERVIKGIGRLLVPFANYGRGGHTQEINELQTYVQNTALRDQLLAITYDQLLSEDTALKANEYKTLIMPNLARYIAHGWGFSTETITDEIISVQSSQDTAYLKVDLDGLLADEQASNQLMELIYLSIMARNQNIINYKSFFKEIGLIRAYLGKNPTAMQEASP